VAEEEIAAARDLAAVFEDREVDVEGDAAEGDDYAQVGQQVQFGFEPMTAVVQFARGGLVVGRRAMSGGGDAGVGELESVVTGAAFGLGREAGRVEDAIEPVAGAVAGEHASGTVGAVGGGGEAEDQELGVGVAEGGDGFAPIVPIEISAPFDAGDLAAMGDEARATGAGDDLSLQNIEAATIHSMKTPFRLDGRIALVTGGASGIGEETCRVLTQAGAAVIIADIDEARAAALARELPGSSVLKLDVADEAAVKSAAAGTKRLDILVNNAGLGLVGNVEETQLADFQRLFRVNVEGVFLMTKYFLPLLLAAQEPARKGVIVNIGSVAGLAGVKRRYAYCGTKGAVHALTRELAVDYPREIRVNCIAPATIETPFVEGYLEKNFKHEKEKVRAELHARQPLGRMGRPDEVAWLALYLCSDEAEFMNGSIVPIDAGYTAQ